MSDLPNTVSDTLRIVLDAKGAEAIHAITANLKAENPHLRLSPSRVASAVVARYLAKYFIDDVNELADVFFDSKEYLEAQVPSAKTDEELRAILAKALAGLSPTSHPVVKRGRKAAPSRDSDDHG